MSNFCNCPLTDGEHSFYCNMGGNNKPRTVVQGTIYRNAYIGDIEVTENAEVTLDKYGINATWIVDGTKEPLQRLNSGLDYSFDAPDTVCPIRAKDQWLDRNGKIVYPNYPYDAIKVDE